MGHTREEHARQHAITGHLHNFSTLLVQAWQMCRNGIAGSKSRSASWKQHRKFCGFELGDRHEFEF
jgi:hypothetical protein